MSAPLTSPGGGQPVQVRRQCPLTIPATHWTILKPTPLGSSTTQQEQQQGGKGRHIQLNVAAAAHESPWPGQRAR